MYCQICDQKTMNCDCTPEERRMHAEIEELKEQIPRWIPVTERLPEKGSAVLGFRAGDPHWGDASYGMAWREIDGESRPGLRWHESGRPTHWMPLPAPPTDGK